MSAPATTHATPPATHGGAKGMVGGAFVILAILLALNSGYKEYKERQVQAEADRKADNIARQAAIAQALAVNALALNNAPVTDFDRRLQFEKVTPTSTDITFPAIIAWVGPGGILVKYPGAKEFVPYKAGKFTPPKGARKTGTYEFAPVDKDNPATVQVFEKVWR